PWARAFSGWATAASGMAGILLARQALATMASRIPGYALSGPPRHPGAGGGGWEPSARMRAIRSQLRPQAWSEMDQFGPKAGRFNLGGPLGGISRGPDSDYFSTHPNPLRSPAGCRNQLARY